MSILTGRAEVRLHGLFTDNMVVQRDLPIKVWGWAQANSTVEVKWNNTITPCKADIEGRWLCTLPAVHEAGPYHLSVSQGNTIHLEHILAGEVWLCSGQSNMEWQVHQARDADKEIRHGDHPQIRHLLVEKTISHSPLEDINTPGWQVCQPETVGNFTAVGYFFARHLQHELGVPIGLIHSSWGGTVCEAWTSNTALKRIEDFRPFLEDFERKKPHLEPLIREQLQLEKQRKNAFKEAMQADLEAWHVPELKDGTWKHMRLPAHWENVLGAFDGVVWYRKQINIPSEWADKKATLSLEAMDDQDWTWVNGNLIGQTTGHAIKRRYLIPADQMKPGPMTLAIRILDTGGEGGLWGNAAGMKLTQAGQSDIPLAGAWKYEIPKAFGDIPERPEPVPFSSPNTPTALYNGMIAPLLPYPIQGAIWYQGESNASRGHQYQTLFPAMIRDWRRRWQLGDFPFIFVQLANYMAPKTDHGPSQWAELREAQSMTLSLPNTGQAVTIDIGDERDIHPRNKQDVGLRLALNALAISYGRNVVQAGPLYESMRIEGDQIRLHFHHVGSGLVARDDKPLSHFEIAGANGIFKWAHASIESDHVIVKHPQIPAPRAARYAWSDNPDGCNLFNREGLPASPFRTKVD
jgi:sialate O-acetylesterase